jgi:hypothetical protein
MQPAALQRGDPDRAIAEVTRQERLAIGKGERHARWGAVQLLCSAAGCI